jgi:hypothetical protein
MRAGDIRRIWCISLGLSLVIWIQSFPLSVRSVNWDHLTGKSVISSFKLVTERLRRPSALTSPLSFHEITFSLSMPACDATARIAVEETPVTGVCEPVRGKVQVPRLPSRSQCDDTIEKWCGTPVRCVCITEVEANADHEWEGSRPR